jgi:hypothetical protein
MNMSWNADYHVFSYHVYVYFYKCTSEILYNFHFYFSPCASWGRKSHLSYQICCILLRPAYQLLSLVQHIRSTFVHEIEP